MAQNSPEVFDLVLDGVVVPGHGVASGKGVHCPYPGGSIRAQAPVFAARGLDLSDCFLGTINVDVSPRTFRVTDGDHVFRDVCWTERIPPEHFTFSRAELEVAGRRQPVWIYWPHPETKIENLQSQSLAEIIGPRIPDLPYGQSCRLHLRSKHVESHPLPRQHAPLPNVTPFTLRLRLRSRHDAPQARPIFRQAGSASDRPGFLLEEMPDGGLRATLAFQRPGAWPQESVNLSRVQRTFMAALPYWRHGGDIERGEISVCVPGHMIERRRWLDLTLTLDGCRLALWLDGVLIDEEWPYGTPALTAELVDQLTFDWELAAQGWQVEARAWTEADALASSPRVAERTRELLGPAEPFGAYWRPRGINTSAGDVMVAHDGRRLHVLALLDRRNSGAAWSTGAHRFGHWTTENLRDWRELPLPLDLEAPAEGAIGTGGLFFDGRRYHVWGNVLCNRVGEPATTTHPHRVVRATSEDGVNFTRVDGAWLDGCEPGLWHEPATGIFHLVCADRRLESIDLETWSVADAALLPPPSLIGDPSDAPTRECYSVWRWNEWTYVVGGRTGFWMARDIRGPFWPGPGGDLPAVRPRWDIYDGTMVPQGVVIHDNRCLLVGWIVDRWWGGRLVFRELRQLADGTLALGWAPELTPAFATPAPLASEAGAQHPAGREEFALEALPGGFAAHAFVLPPGDAHLEFRLRPEPGTAAYGVCFRATSDYRGGRELRLDPLAREARWGAADGGPAPHLDRPRHYAEEFAIANVENLEGPEVTLRVILRDWVIDVWINGERTLLTRQHEPAGDRLFIFMQSGRLRFTAPLYAPLLSPS